MVLNSVISSTGEMVTIGAITSLRTDPSTTACPCITFKLSSQSVRELKSIESKDQSLDWHWTV